MQKRTILASLIALSLALASCAVFGPSRSYEAPEKGFVESLPLAPSISGDFANQEPQPAPAEGAAGNLAGENLPAAEERLVVRNASLTLVVPDPAVSITEISRMAREMGGFVVNSNLFQTTFGEGIQADQASITIRIPAERLEEALDQIKENASEVKSENVSGQDVTEEYTDLQSRLRNLEDAEAQLREIMASAVKTEDVLDVFETLRQITGEIEVIKGRLQYYEESARLSAISVELIPDVASQPLQIGRWRPQGTVKEAVKALIKAYQWLVDAAIWLAIFVLPIALVPLAIGIAAWLVVRSIIRKRRKGKAAPAEEQSD